MVCIVLVGLARSGKDTFADYLVEKHGFKKFVFSSILTSLAVEKKIVPSKLNLMKLGDELRGKEGMGAVAVHLLKKVNGDKVILVGARSKEEFFEVKKKFPNATLVSITSSKNTRFNRRNKLDPDSRKEFFSRDKIDAEKKGLTELINLSNFKINNNGSLKELFAQADELVKKI